MIWYTEYDLLQYSLFPPPLPSAFHILPIPARDFRCFLRYAVDDGLCRGAVHWTVLARGCDAATGYHALVSVLCALTSSAGILRINVEGLFIWFFYAL